MPATRAAVALGASRHPLGDLLRGEVGDLAVLRAADEDAVPREPELQPLFLPGPEAAPAMQVGVNF